MEELSTLEFIVLGIIVLLNIQSYLLYFTDKKRAVHHKRDRISEKNLLVSAFLFGGIGALLGMTLNRHKTKRFKFTLLVPIAAMITAYTILFILN